MPYIVAMIERGKILREIRKRAKSRGRDVRVDTKAGKGSHAKVYVGQRRTVVPQRASPALVRAIMKQLDLED